MSHLVRPLPGPGATDEGDPARCAELLSEAEAYLARRGQAALRGLSGDEDVASWGRQMKRVKVSLDGPHPVLVTARGQHNLIEVINQCATLERLIDALGWVRGEPSLQGLRVLCCHPTTSSFLGAGDNDLVLGVSTGDVHARFEVSDVSGHRDGNEKELKDLVSLGLVPDKQGTLRHEDERSRRFLVVSGTFARHIVNRRRRVPLPFRYSPVATRSATGDDSATVILELVPVIADPAARAAAGGGTVSV